MDVCDVAVVGAGPSGLTAAIRLRQMGRSVVVLDRPRRRPSGVEMLTPGVADMVRYLRADGILARAGATPVQRNRVAWSTRDAVTRELVPDETSFLVDRQRFVEQLANAASAQGVLLRPSSRTIGHEMRGRQYLVRYAHNGFERAVMASQVIEATGRPRASRSKRLGPPLMALCANFEATVGDECEMLVEALTDGWVLMVRQPGGVLQVTAFCDPSYAHSCWPGDPKRALSALLASSVHLSKLGEVGFFDGVCDAGSYFFDEFFSCGTWKIGDGAFCLDPLSSSGVEKSMRFALQAALAVNTVIKSDGEPGIAREFLTGKLNEACARHLAWTKEYYASAWRWPTGSFWKMRGSVQPNLKGRENTHVLVDQRQISPLMLLEVPCIAADVVLKRTPCALEDHIETKEGVFHPSFAEPVVFVDGVELAPLLRTARGVCSYPELIERWSRVLSRGRAIRICAWALQNGILNTDRGEFGASMVERPHLG